MQSAALIFQAIFAFLLATFIFDICHYVLHQCLKSKRSWLRTIGRLHLHHHRFLTPSLHIEKSATLPNLRFHIVLEQSIQCLAILACHLFLPWTAIYIALILQFIILGNILYTRGIDRHHQPQAQLKAYRRPFFVDANYHALHHVYPQYFFSSYIKLLDIILGTAQPLTGKYIALTGANGALGSHMRHLLEKEGAIILPIKFGVDYTYTDYSNLTPILAKADILFLCHGTKYDDTQQANCDSFIAIIEIFKRLHRQQLVPPEIWAVGSEIECHPCFGIKKLYPYATSKRNFARTARVYYADQTIQYRHIVHSAFISKMGPGLMTARFAAKLTLFLLKRGWKYIPVTYTGFALVNYFRFHIASVSMPAQN